MADKKPKNEPEQGQSVITGSESDDDEIETVEKDGDEYLFDPDADEPEPEDEDDQDMTDETSDDDHSESDKTETSQGQLHDASQAGDPETQKKPDSEPTPQVEESEGHDVSDDTDLSDEERQELADRTKHIDYTVKLISSQNMGILVGETDNWINFDADLSALDKESMRDRLESLWDSGDAIASGINLTVVNKGTDAEPELRFVDFNSEPADDDFEPMTRDDMGMDDDNNTGGDSRSAGDNDLSASASYDQAMEALKNADGMESFSIETSEPLMKQIDDETMVFVKATVEINPESGRSHKHQGTGTKGGDDGARSITKDSAIEVAETRAVKRAIRNTGVLIDGSD